MPQKQVRCAPHLLDSDEAKELKAQLLMCPSDDADSGMRSLQRMEEELGVQLTETAPGVLVRLAGSLFASLAERNLVWQAGDVQTVVGNNFAGSNSIIQKKYDKV